MKAIYFIFASIIFSFFLYPIQYETGTNKQKEGLNRNKKSIVRNIVFTSISGLTMGTGFIGAYAFEKKGDRLYDEYQSSYITKSATDLGDRYSKSYDTADFFNYLAESGIVLTGIFATWLVIDIAIYSRYKKINRMQTSLNVFFNKGKILGVLCTKF